MVSPWAEAGIFLMVWILLFGLLIFACETMEKAVQKRQVRCKNNGLVIGKGRNKICFLYEPGSLEAAKRVRQCYDMLQKHIEPALPCFRQTGQDLLDRRAFYRRCRLRLTILLLIGCFFGGVFCHNCSDPDATVMLIAAVVVLLFGLLSGRRSS